MATTVETSRFSGSRDATMLMLLALAVVVLGLTVLYVPEAQPAAVPAAYALPFILIAGLIISVRILSFGTKAIPLGIMLVGCSFVFSGAVFDVVATIIHSPDLAQETNPVARVLLDNGHSIGFVYVYAGFCQFAFASLICVLWASLLRHRTVIIDAVRNTTSLMQLVKSLAGGASLTWRQWLFPLRMADLPDCYFLTWVATVMWVAGAGYRWYLGLEWFGFSPVDSVYVAISSTLIGLSAYVVWARREIQQSRDESAINDQTPCAVSES